MLFYDQPSSKYFQYVRFKNKCVAFIYVINNIVIHWKIIQNTWPLMVDRNALGINKGFYGGCLSFSYCFNLNNEVLYITLMWKNGYLWFEDKHTYVAEVIFINKSSPMFKRMSRNRVSVKCLYISIDNYLVVWIMAWKWSYFGIPSKSCKGLFTIYKMTAMYRRKLKYLIM